MRYVYLCSALVFGLLTQGHAKTAEFTMKGVNRSASKYTLVRAFHIKQKAGSQRHR